MYSGLVLDSESWWSDLTASIFLPDLGTLMPSPTRISRSLTRSGSGKQPQHYLRPQRGHLIQPNASTMKVIE